MKTDYRGIDYSGLTGTCNRDSKTGIRYGVIPQNAVLQAWCDSSEGFYGDAHCPKCGNEAVEMNYENTKQNDRDGYDLSRGACGDYACDECKLLFDGDEAFGDEPLSHYIDDGEYAAETSDCVDIFISKSPFYTRAQFCSPCAPGACYLQNPCDDGERAYCFAPDWFYDGDPCPYPVYRVDDDSLVYWPAGYFDGILFPESE